MDWGPEPKPAPGAGGGAPVQPPGGGFGGEFGDGGPVGPGGYWDIDAALRDAVHVCESAEGSGGAAVTVSGSIVTTAL